MINTIYYSDPKIAFRFGIQVFLFFCLSTGVVYGQYSRSELDSLAKHYPLIGWESGRSDKSVKSMHRLQMYPLMQSLQDKELTKQMSRARTKRTFGILFMVVASIISIIPKESTQNLGGGLSLTAKESGLLARPEGLLFYAPGLFLQFNANDNNQKALKRYNEVVKARFHQ